MKRIKVALLDSGIERTHSTLQKLPVTQFVCDNEKWERRDYVPKYGHGTAIASILARNAEQFDIHSYVIAQDKSSVSPKRCIGALEAILDSDEHYDIIHMSLGVRQYNKKLETLCAELDKKNKVLVSAFDNIGAVSYPAAFSTVIGVDASFDCLKSDDFIFVSKDGYVNVMAKGGNQRIAWLNNSFVITQGSSFAAAYVSAYIITLLQQNVLKENLLAAIKDKSFFVHKQEQSIKMESPCRYFSIKKAVLFPCNKESSSLLRFSGLLDFEITDVFDTKFSGNLGDTIQGLDTNNSYLIKNIKDCAWTGFDAFILGHTHELEYFSRENIRKNIIELCRDHGVNLFSFDNDGLDQTVYSEFKEKNLHIYYPQIFPEQMPDTMGKMRTLKTPVLGVFGTSKQQGKFTLQLQLRRRFIRDGYAVGQLGSEPESLLFGMDYVYPFGYKKNIEIDNLTSIEYLNYCMHCMDKKDYDLIITGSQSGTLPLLYTHINNYPLDCISFLLGTLPDAVILCVNYHDKIHDITRTVRGIEALARCKVIACSLFLFGYKDEWDLVHGGKTLISEDKLEEFKRQVSSVLSIPCFTLDENDGPEQLYQTAIKFFSQQGERNGKNDY